MYSRSHQQHLRKNVKLKVENDTYSPIFKRI